MKKTALHAGFTLIELVVVVAILGILSAIALPSYRQYVIKSNRVEAKTGLATVALAQERYYSVNNSYASSVASLGLSASAVTPNGFYAVTIENVASGSYLLRATPTGAQSGDQCGQLTLDSTGKKDIASAYTGKQWSDCW